MSLTGVINGTNALLFREGVLIGGMIDTTRTPSGSPIKISNPSNTSFSSYLDGELSNQQESISTKIIYSNDEAYQQIRIDRDTGKQASYTLVYDNKSEDSETVTALFVPTSLSDPMTMGEKIATSVTFLSSGDVERTRFGASPSLPDLTSGRFSIPLTYDEESSNGFINLTRQGVAPWLTTEGMKGDGVSARYRVEPSDLPSFISSGPLTLHATVSPQGGARNSVRDVIVSACEDTEQASPKLEIAVLDDVVGDRAVCAARAETSIGTQDLRLFRDSWNYKFRFPELEINGFQVRPQGILFLSSTELLISGHYENTLSRVFKINLLNSSVVGFFDLPEPYVHVGSISSRESDDSVWLGDFASRALIQVDLDLSFSSGSAEILTTYSLPDVVGFAAVEWVNSGGVEYLLSAEYSASGNRYIYVIPATEIVDGDTFAPSDRFKRFTIGASEMQGIKYQNDKLFVSVNELNSDIERTGKVVMIDIDNAISSQPDGAPINIEFEWHGPSECVQDIAFHPTTGELWMGTEGYDSVGSDIGWLGVWSGTLAEINDGNFTENSVTIEYDGASTTVVKVNNQLFDIINGSISVAPEVLSIGGPPVTESGQNNGYFIGTVRNIVLQNSPMSSDEYLAAVDGSQDEPNSLTAYDITIQNAGAETGDTSGWVDEVGGLGVRPQTVAFDVHNGVNYFFGGPNLLTVSIQIADLQVATGLSQSDIAVLGSLDDIWARVDWWQNSFAGNGDSDIGGVGVRTIDSEGAVISETISDLIETSPQFVDWIHRGQPKLLESGTSEIAIVIRMERLEGTNNDTYLDDITLKVYTR